VEYVYVIGDYERYLANCIDPSISNLHKQLDTKHRWHFEQVDESVDFPFGVKTMYRTYASDSVVEFVKNDNVNCTSHMGKLIGLDPFHCLSRWMPLAGELNSRTCDGFYILAKLPTEDFIPVAEFKEMDNFSRQYKTR